MATSTTKKSNFSKDDTSDCIEDTDINSSLAEERRFFHSQPHSSAKPPTQKGFNKRISKFNTCVNHMMSEMVDEELQKRQLSISGEIDIRRHRLKNHYKAEVTFGCDNPLKMIEQDFEYIAVLDFEATCQEDQGNKYPHEIIEFPIVLINVQEQTIVDRFQSYCRPIKKPKLTKFCTDLTSIEQHQVDNAPVFAEVLNNVETWLKERNLLSSTNKRRLAFATDGPWDFVNFLQMQCEFSSLAYPQWALKWINIRKEFSNFYGVRRCGIEKMLGKLGLTFDGRRHSGLDDAVNIARIAVELLKDGCVLSLNDRIPGSNHELAEGTDENTESKNDEEFIVFTE